MSQNYQTHMYMICYPSAALVLSQLGPEEFGFRYNYGSASYYAGKLIFAQLDINFRHPYFKIDEAMKEMKPHPDGSPKATKYVSSYRILEHIDLSAIQVLYLANSDGTSYPLYPGDYTTLPSQKDLRIYAEITPVNMLTLAKFSMRDFGRWFTSPENIIHVPRILYTQVSLDIDTFLSDFERNPLMPSPLEDVHPSKLRDAILDLRGREEKYVKAITLNTSFHKESYRKIRHGFMFADAHGQKFFPMPELNQVEQENLRFYRGM